MKKYLYISLLFATIILISCKTKAVQDTYYRVLKENEYVASRKPHKEYVNLRDIFSFNNQTKTFEYYESYEHYFRYAKGNYLIKDNLLILNTDTNLNQLPLHVVETGLKQNTTKSILIFNLTSYRKDNDKIDYKLITDDSSVYIIKPKDTLIINKNIKAFFLKIDISKSYEPIIVDGTTLYVSDYGENKLFKTKTFSTNGGNQFKISFHLSASLLNYQSFVEDTLIIVGSKKPKIKIGQFIYMPSKKTDKYLKR